jgi:hypothetical protein
MEEKASGKKLRKMRDRIEKDMKDREEETKVLKERMQKMEERLKEEMQKLEKEDKVRQERLDRVEANVTRDRKERQDCERKKEEYQERYAEMESRKEMEKKVEAAMEQMKILNLDFGRECNERTTLVEEAIRLLQEKVGKQDREEFGRIMKGTRVSILGHGTDVKEEEKGMIHTVPVLLTCRCRSEKERLENIVRKEEPMYPSSGLRRAWTL